MGTELHINADRKSIADNHGNLFKTVDESPSEGARQESLLYCSDSKEILSQLLTHADVQRIHQVASLAAETLPTLKMIDSSLVGEGSIDIGNLKSPLQAVCDAHSKTDERAGSR